MKIYNEIITKFNEKTQKWETISEDSFEYGGTLLLLQTGQPDPNPDVRLVCNGEGDAGHGCCQLNTQIILKDSEGGTLDLAYPVDSFPFCGLDGGSWDYSTSFFWHSTLSSYGDPFAFSDYNDFHVCCIPNNVKHVEFINAVPYADDVWNGPTPFCWSVGEDLENPWGQSGPTGCLKSNGDAWDLDYIDLGNNEFHKIPSSYDVDFTWGTYSEFTNASDQVQTRQQDWLCGLASGDSQVFGCSGFVDDYMEGTDYLECGCPNAYGTADACFEIGVCDSFIPCTLDSTVNDHFCSSGMNCNGTGGSCMTDSTYPAAFAPNIFCYETNHCGICNGGEGASDECCLFEYWNWDVPSGGMVMGDECVIEANKVAECCNCANTVYDDCLDYVGEEDSCGGWARYNEETGLWMNGPLSPLEWCSCNNRIVPTSVGCYDRRSLVNEVIYGDVEVCLIDGTDQPDEFAQVFQCEDYPFECTPWDVCIGGNGEAGTGTNCCNFISEYSDVLLDEGCMDETACNYSSLYDEACGDCCIYAASYCVANGSLYPLASWESVYEEAPGESYLCDVDSNGNPEIHVYCPICDCDGTNTDCPLTTCGDGYSDLDPGGGGGEVCQGSCLFTQEHVAHLASGLFIFAMDGIDGDVPDNMLDTCQSNCGPGGYDLAGWQLTGCTDPASLDYGSELPPLWPDSGVGITNELPVESCRYCPETYAATQLGCPAGYDFYWEYHYSTSNVTTTANVSAGTNWGEGENFHLDETSNTLISHESGGDIYSNGACFCRTDLEFLDIFTDLQTGVYPALQMNTLGGSQEWNENGRLSKFSAGGDQCNDTCTEISCPCRDAGLTLGNDGNGSIPTEIGNLTSLTYLDLSYGYLRNAIPPEIGQLTNLTELNLSYNFFNELSTGDHNITTAGESFGICNLVEINGTPTVQGNDNNWLKLMGNKICPDILSEALSTIQYPLCLSPHVGDYTWSNPAFFTPEWQAWVYSNLGFIDLPLYDNFNEDAQWVMNEEGKMDCDNIKGCLVEHATNYWPEAPTACAGDECCTFDRFLHFKWGEGQDGAPTGFGGNMTIFEMIQALHADIYGFQYNSFGQLDVTHYPNSAIDSSGHVDACDYTGAEDYLPYETLYHCMFGFGNDPSLGGSWTDYINGNGIINHWDGIWLRDSGYQGDGSCEVFTGAFIEDPINGMQSCLGDARPLDFIQRVEWIDSINPGGGYKNYWFNQFFPAYGADISMQGIEWFHEYDLANDGIGYGSQVMWEDIGRYDISEAISEMPPYPPEAPDDVELWEQSPVFVSMSYARKFISEADAGFSLWPETNSPGVLRRSGQWICADSGDASVCYEDLMACSDGLPDWVEDCTPCGMETSPDSERKCIPLTSDIAAEGHEKISKTKIISIPYFSDGNSTSISGSDIYTASLSSSNHPYYFSVTNGDPGLPKYDVQFDVAWGHYAGSGSVNLPYTKGTSETIYKQHASLLLDDSAVDDGFLISSGSDVTASSAADIGDAKYRDEFIYTLNFKRKRFEDNLQPANWTLTLSGSKSDGTGITRHLTDDSAVNTLPIINNDRGRRFNIISGSNGTPYSEYSVINGRYGFMYPEMGIMVFGEKLSNEIISGSAGAGTVSPSVGAFNIASDGNNQLMPNTGSNADGKNALRFINCMRNVDGNSLTLSGEKEVTDVIFICILRVDDFNFTNNFTILSGSGRTMYSDDTGVMNGFPTSTHDSMCFTGSAGDPSSQCSGSEPITTTTNEFLDDGGSPFVWPGSNVATMHGSPTSFITGIELYDGHGECVAIARPSHPIQKAHNREVLIKIKLRF